MTTANKFCLIDPSGEASIVFCPQADGATVRVTRNCHPDLPSKVTTVTLEEGREAYRAALRDGYIVFPLAVALAGA